MQLRVQHAYLMRKPSCLATIRSSTKHLTCMTITLQVMQTSHVLTSFNTKQCIYNSFSALAFDNQFRHKTVSKSNSNIHLLLLKARQNTLSKHAQEVSKLTSSLRLRLRNCEFELFRSLDDFIFLPAFFLPKRTALFVRVRLHSHT